MISTNKETTVVSAVFPIRPFVRQFWYYFLVESSLQRNSLNCWRRQLLTKQPTKPEEVDDFHRADDAESKTKNQKTSNRSFKEA